MKIGIILPTRGLVFTKVLEAIEKERKGYDIEVYISNGLPIPNGHNSLCQKALEDGSQTLLFIEEDTVPPTGAFERLFASKADITCIDYGVNSWSCVARDKNDEILWCGLGCTAVKRYVFEALKMPYFRSDVVLELPDMTWRQLPENYVKTRNYGGLDIWFCMQAREKGFKIEQLEGEADHLKLVKLGESGINFGCHEVGLKPKIEKHQII